MRRGEVDGRSLRFGGGGTWACGFRIRKYFGKKSDTLRPPKGAADCKALMGGAADPDDLIVVDARSAVGAQSVIDRRSKRDRRAVGDRSAVEARSARDRRPTRVRKCEYKKNKRDRRSVYRHMVGDRSAVEARSAIDRRPAFFANV